jgi:hypothetical protein
MTNTNRHAARSRSMHFPGNRVDSATPPSSAHDGALLLGLYMKMTTKRLLYG